MKFSLKESRYAATALLGAGLFGAGLALSPMSQAEPIEPRERDRVERGALRAGSMPPDWLRHMDELEMNWRHAAMWSRPNAAALREQLELAIEAKRQRDHMKRPDDMDYQVRLSKERADGRTDRNAFEDDMRHAREWHETLKREFREGRMDRDQLERNLRVAENERRDRIQHEERAAAERIVRLQREAFEDDMRDAREWRDALGRMFHEGHIDGDQLERYLREAESGVRPPNRYERDRLERDKREAAEREKREAAEREEREAIERMERDRVEREESEAAEREAAEAAERAQREELEGLDAMPAEAEREEREAAEREAEDTAEREAEATAEREAEDTAEREAEDTAEREAEDTAEREAEAAAEREAEAAAEREAEAAEPEPEAAESGGSPSDPHVGGMHRVISASVR